MRKGVFIVLACLLALAAAPALSAQENPRRPTTVVDDVFEPYTADEWIVAPDDEEPADDQETGDYPACDIYAVISCCDDTYLRIDILTNNAIDPGDPLFYAIRVEYDTMNEYYTWYTDTEKLVYEKEKGGKIVQTKVLTRDDSDDLAGITDAPDLERRRASALALTAAIGGLDGVIAPPEVPWARHTYFAYQFSVDPGKYTASRDQLAAAIRAEGVPVIPSYLPKPLHRYGFLAKPDIYNATRCPLDCPHHGVPVDYAAVESPRMELGCGRSFFLPWNEKITKENARDIGGAIAKVLAHHQKRRP